MWKACCNKSNKHFDFEGIYRSVSVIVGNKIVDIVENYNGVELVLDNGCRECIFGGQVSCTFIGEKEGKVLDVAISKRSIVIIHTDGVIRIRVEKPWQTYLRCGNKKLYEWRA